MRNMLGAKSTFSYLKIGKKGNGEKISELEITLVSWFRRSSENEILGEYSNNLSHSQQENCRFFLNQAENAIFFIR